MKYRDLSFIAIIAFVVSGLQLLARVNRPPGIPHNFSHSIVSRDTRAQGPRCHRRIAQPAPAAFDQPHKQPKQWRANKLDCLLCHRDAVR